MRDTKQADLVRIFVANAVASLLFAVMPSFSQTNEPTDASGPKIWSAEKQAWVERDSTQHTNGPAAAESLTPDKRDWTVSGGLAIARDATKLSSQSAQLTGRAYGGYVALDYFVTKAISLRPELVIVSNSQTVNGFSASRTEYVVDIGGKFYPLQLTKLTEFRLQPFLRVSLGGVFYDVTATGTSINADPAAIVGVGGGADVVITAEWSVTVGADYYWTLTDTTVTGLVFSTMAREYGALITVGVRYRF